jgi:nucleoid-associated protein YgaU
VSSRVEVAGGKYRVQPNDNYWVIAEKLYGNAGYFKALQAYNQSRTPQHADGLAVGDSISAPTAEELMKAYPNLCPKPRKLPSTQLARQASNHRPLGSKVYVVEEGDTLFDVARYELGKASRWAEIYDLNRDVLGEDFDYLKPGTQLVLPNDRTGEDRMTRQPTGRKLR